MENAKTRSVACLVLALLVLAGLLWVRMSVKEGGADALVIKGMTIEAQGQAQVQVQAQARKSGPAAIDIDKSSVSLGVGEIDTVTIDLSGSLPKAYRLDMSTEGQGYSTLEPMLSDGRYYLIVSGDCEGAGTIELSLDEATTGEVLAKVAIPVKVIEKRDTATARVSVSKPIISLATGETREVAVHAAGTLPENHSFFVDCDCPFFDAVMLRSVDDCPVVVIIGKAKGRGRASVYLWDSSVGAMLASTTILVEVT